MCEEMKDHKEFMVDVANASSLPAQTCRALSPESDEDISMYANDVLNVKGESQ